MFFPFHWSNFSTIPAIDLLQEYDEIKEEFALANPEHYEQHGLMFSTSYHKWDSKVTRLRRESYDKWSQWHDTVGFIEDVATLANFYRLRLSNYNFDNLSLSDTADEQLPLHLERIGVPYWWVCNVYGSLANTPWHCTAMVELHHLHAGQGPDFFNYVVFPIPIDVPMLPEAERIVGVIGD